MVRNANVRFTSGAIYPEQPKYLPSKRASGTRAGTGTGTETVRRLLRPAGTLRRVCTR